MIHRPRRNRRSKNIRSLLEETAVNANDLVYPVFITEGIKQKQPIDALPGQFRYSVDELLYVCEDIQNKNLKALALFPKIEENLKNKTASEALNPDGLVPRCVREVKKRFPDLTIITDVALDPYSSDGHDGLVDLNGNILNDESVELLAQMALIQAQAGADYVAPSDMMDGRVRGIRSLLDKNKLSDTGILSYTAKYASCFYGPFRSALDSAPKAGDKKTYQMNPANSKEALLELKLDFREGADIVMVKPALAYLDIIRLVKEKSPVPVAAYNVSGEYAMIKAAAQKGWLDEKAAVHEVLLSIKRAGADIIFTYFAKDYF